jgi:membrane-associated PAP2 superfamily phosphatase
MALSRAGAPRLRSYAVIMCWLLLAQFVLGMITNLYVTIPARHPGTGESNYFAAAAASVAWSIGHGEGWLAAHATLGLALVVTSFALIAAAIRSRDRMWIAASVLGACFMIGAGFNGASFLIFGKNLSSLLMSALFALSLGSYLTALFTSAHRAG